MFGELAELALFSAMGSSLAVRFKRVFQLLKPDSFLDWKADAKKGEKKDKESRLHISPRTVGWFVNQFRLKQSWLWKLASIMCLGSYFFAGASILLGLTALVAQIDGMEIIGSRSPSLLELANHDVAWTPARVTAWPIKNPSGEIPPTNTTNIV